MKFTSKIVKKAWELYHEKTANIAGNVKELKGYLSDAYRASIKFFKSMKKGIIKFWKLSGEIVTRRCATLDYIGYIFKGNRINNNLFYFVDLDKLENGEEPIICINNFQIL